MRIELVQIAALLPANIALPRVTLAVTTFMEEVQRLIRKRNATVSTLEAARAGIRSGRGRWFASRVWIGINAAAATTVVTAVIVVIGGTGGELAAQIVAQQRFQRGHFDQ